MTKTVIQVRTEHGVTGLGECADGDQALAVMTMAQRLIGCDVRDINAARARCVPAMAYSSWANVTAARRVFGGLEMAFWDARGKAEGRSVADLMGGAVRTKIPLTEYFSYRLAGPHEPGENSPIDVARYCARMIEQHGSQIFEGKVGTVGLDQEVRMVAEIRQAIGQRPLYLDANGTWSVPTARAALRALAPYDLTWFEEPCETYEEMAALRAHSDISFSAHAIDLPKAARLGCPDAIVTNSNEHGGLQGTSDFIAACAAMGVGFRFHSGETGIASAAYMHLTASHSHVGGASQTLLRWYGDDVIEGGPHEVRDGVATLPAGPGLGVHLDPKALARCHERYLTEGSFPSGDPWLGYGEGFRKS